MTHPEQTTLLAEFYAEKKNVLKLKGEDYANEDVLSNFKTAGANCGISAELQCLSLIATKVARLGNLLTGKTPNNESISDSILDLSNYTDLLYCLVNEKDTDDVNKPKTKRWENVKPVEDYKIKVGDKFIDQEDEIFTIVLTRDERVIYRYKKSSMLDVNGLEREQFLENIRKGVFKRIN